MKVVRLIIHDFANIHHRDKDMAQWQSDGKHSRHDCCSYTIITLVRGGWLRSLWRAWRSR